MRLHNLAIDEKVPLMEATEAEDVINQPFTVQQNPTATAVVLRERIVERFCEGIYLRLTCSVN